MTLRPQIVIGIIAAAFVAGGVAGRIAPRPAVATQAKSVTKVEQTATTEVAETTRDVDHKDVTTTVTRKADGSSTSVTVDHSVIKDKTSETIDKKVDTTSTNSTNTTTFAPPAKNWSLGLSYAPAYALTPLPYNPMAFTPSVGYRVAGDIWVEASFQAKSHTPTIGIRLEF